MTEPTQAPFAVLQYPDGIYFNMPFKVYMAQDRHSNSRVNKVNESVLSFWVDEIEPTLQPDFDLEASLQESSDAMAEGKAWHVMALEGVEAFSALYATDYDPADYPNAIKSGDEHREACKDNGLSDKGTIAAMQERLQETGARVEFHRVLAAEHKARNEGKTLIAPNKMKELLIAGEVMAQYKIQDDFLDNGFPEVSILFTMNGERFKIRVDWLAATKQVEFKTITRKSRKKPFEQSCADQMHDFGYMPAGYLYTCGVEIAREGVRNIINNKTCDFFIDSGEVPDAWFDSFAYCEKPEYWFLFQERGKYNHVLPRRFDKYDEALQNRKIQAIWKTGRVDVVRAVSLYKWYMANNGKTKRWLPPLNPKPWGDEDFKPWQIEE